MTATLTAPAPRLGSWTARLDDLFRQELFLARTDALAAEDRHRVVHRRLRAANAALGLDRALVADPDRLHALLARAAVHDPSLCHVLAVHLGAGIGVIAEYGAGAAAEQLARLESGAATACVLITEAGHGASHIAQRTTATFDPVTRDFVLHTPDDAARKLPSSAGLPGVAKIGLVSAQLVVGGLRRAVFTFAVELSDESGPRPGVTITALPESVLLPVDHAAVRFDHVRVPFTCWLADGAEIDDTGAFHDPVGTPDARLVRTLGFVSGMQLGACVAAVAVTRASVAGAVHEAYRRTTMGRLRPGVPVIAYRTHQRALFQAMATTYALGCLTDHARAAQLATRPAGGLVSSSPWTAANRLTALTKVRVTEAADQVIGVCLQRACAHQWLSGPFAAYRGLVQGYQLAAGSNQLIKLDAARAMAEGDEYRAPVSGLPDPAARDPLDPELWRHLLRRREASLHRELRTGLDVAGSGDELARWNPLLPLAEDLADAHQDRVLLEQALAGARRVPAALRPGVDLLCALLALEMIDRHSGWYLCAGLLTTTQACALDDLRSGLCDRLEPHARALVDTSLNTGGST